MIGRLLARSTLRLSWRSRMTGMPSDLASPFEFARDVAVFGRFLRLARPTHDVQMVDPDSNERRPHVFAPCA